MPVIPRSFSIRCRRCKLLCSDIGNDTRRRATISTNGRPWRMDLIGTWLCKRQDDIQRNSRFFDDAI